MGGIPFTTIKNNCKLNIKNIKNFLMHFLFVYLKSLLKDLMTFCNFNVKVLILFFENLDLIQKRNFW